MTPPGPEAAKKGSNDERTHPQDPDAKITKMKDGRIHSAHKAKHAVVPRAAHGRRRYRSAPDAGDTTTMVETLLIAADQVEAMPPTRRGVAEAVGDKGAAPARSLRRIHPLAASRVS